MTLKKGSKSDATFHNISTIFLANTKENDVEADGELVITKFDLTNKIVSGTFWFRLEKQGKEAIEAIDGKFNITF